MGEGTAQEQGTSKTACECFLEILAEMKGHPFWINESFEEHTLER